MEELRNLTERISALERQVRSMTESITEDLKQLTTRLDEGGRNAMRHIEYTNVLKPNVEYLRNAGTLFLDSRQMSEFLAIPQSVLAQLVYTDRTPLPVRLGLGKCFRWSVLELAEWMEAGCPRRRQWVELRGHSGWFPLNPP